MSKCQNLTINFFFYWVILQQHFYASSVNKFIYGYLDLKITYPIPLLELLISLYSLFIHGLLLGQNSVYLAIWWLWSYKKMTHFLCTYLQILWKLISHECVKCKHLLHTFENMVYCKIRTWDFSAFHFYSIYFSLVTPKEFVYQCVSWTSFWREYMKNEKITQNV